MMVKHIPISMGDGKHQNTWSSLLFTWPGLLTFIWHKRGAERDWIVSFYFRNRQVWMKCRSNSWQQYWLADLLGMVEWPTLIFDIKSRQPDDTSYCQSSRFFHIIHNNSLIEKVMNFKSIKICKIDWSSMSQYRFTTSSIMRIFSILWVLNKHVTQSQCSNRFYGSNLQATR